MRKEEVFTLKYFFNLIFRRLNLAIFSFLIFFILLLIYNFRKSYVPIYRATFEIGISRERISEEFFGERNVSSFYQIAGGIQRIMSNIMNTELLKKIVDSLGLYLKIEDGKDIKIDSRIKNEYDGNLGPFIITFADDENFEVKENNGKVIGIGKIGEYFDLKHVEFKIYKNNRGYKNLKITFYSPARIALAIRNSINIKILEMNKLEKEISSGIPYSGEIISKNLVSAGELAPSLNILGVARINLYWGNPDDALKITKCLSEFLLKQDILERSKKYVQSRKFIESQLSLYSSKLDSIENEIRNFKEKKKIIGLEAKTQGIISKLSELESKKEEIEIKEKMLYEIKEKILKKEIISDTISNFLFVILDDPILTKYYTNLIDSETEYKTFQKEYSKEHPKLKEVSSKISAIKEGMKEEIIKRIESMKNEKKGIEDQIKGFQEKLKDIPQSEILLAKLERERERTEKLYSFFAEKLEEVRIQEAGITPEFKIVNPPIVSNVPVNKRNTSLILIFSFLISLFVSALFVFALEYFDPRIKDVDVLKNIVPLFGTIPSIYEKGDFFNFKFLKKKKEDSFKIIEDKSSYEYEHFKKLSFNITYAHPEKKYKLIYIISGIASEGKTFITSNLGVVLSDMGKKVLIIDSDFRKKRGHISEIFGLEEGKGMFEYLSDNATLKEIIKEVGENLYIMQAGTFPPNIGVYLESKKFENLLNELKNDFDYILIDGVPILLFSDSMYIASKVDGVIIVVRYSFTNFDVLQEEVEIIKNSGGNLIGVVFNYVPFKRGGYYYYKYYRYYSKYYKNEKN
ncbi:MAG: polysaccharide biosynthesis tyrosine autokinase [candidate division WOR-3 bacterium]